MTENNSLRERAHDLISEAIEEGDVTDLYRHIKTYIRIAWSEMFIKHPEINDPDDDLEMPEKEGTIIPPAPVVREMETA